MQSVPITTNVVSSKSTQASVLDTTLCDKVCQWLATGWWFSLGIYSIGSCKSNYHTITTTTAPCSRGPEQLLKLFESNPNAGLMFSWYQFDIDTFNNMVKTTKSQSTKMVWYSLIRLLYWLHENQFGQIIEEIIFFETTRS